MVTILDRYRVSFSMFLGHGPLSFIYGTFYTHISECVWESSCPGKRKVGIWEPSVKEDEELRFKLRKKHFASSTPGTIKWQKHIHQQASLYGATKWFHFLKHVH